MLLRNEFQFLIRQPLVWLACLILPAFSFVLGLGLGGENVDAGKQIVHIHTVLIMLSVPILVAAIAPLILIRDDSCSMHELIAVTPVSKSRRYLSRYITMVLFSFSLVTLAVTLSTISLWQVSNELLVVPTLVHLIILLLPAVLFLSAIAFALAQLSRGANTVYLVFAVFWMSYVLLASLSGSPIMAGSTVISESLLDTMIWLDPFGFTAYFQPILAGEAPTLSVDVLLNRCVFMALTALVVSTALRFNPSRPKLQSRSIKSNLSTQHSHNGPLIEHTQYLQVEARPTAFLSTVELTRTALFTFFRNKLNLLILIGWSVLIFTETSAGLSYAEAHAVLQPNSHDALNRVLWDVVAKIGALLLLFWAWQFTWRNKQANIQELIGASPISSSVLVLSQIVALFTVILTLLLLTACAVSAAELVVNSERDFTVYGQYLIRAFAPLAILATLFLAINTWCRSQLTAIGLCLLVVVVKLTPLTELLGIQHPLWDIAGTPLVASDQLWGFAASETAFLPFILVWSLAITALTLLAINQSHRGTGIKPQLNSILTASNLGIVSLFVIVLSIAHSFLLSQNPFVGFTSSEQWRAQYEKHYQHWQNLPQPLVTHIASHVDFYPEQAMADIALNLTLKNMHEEAIERVLVGGFALQHYDKVEIEGAELTSFDVDLNQYEFSFEKAFKPQEIRHLKVEMTYQQPSLFAASMHQVVKPEFSYLRGVPIVPSVGFNPNMRIRKNAIRDDYDLAPIPMIPPSELFAEPHKIEGQYDWTTMHSIVSTPISQHGLAQGNLIKQWKNDERSYYEYASPKPIRNIPAWLSLPFQPDMAHAEEIKLKVFSPAAKETNALHLSAMQITSQWFLDNGMAHQFGELSLVSTPDIGPAGYALPGVLLINHKVGFRAFPTENAGYDQRFRITVHETAHQWFGHGIGNGVNRDRAFLVESMTKYLELVLLEQEYGAEAAAALVDYERERFRLQRANNQLEPLSLIDARASFEMYSGATVIFSQLRKRVGDKPIVDALKTIWHQHKYPQVPATSMDFIRALKHQLGSKWHDQIDKLFLTPLTIDSEFMQTGDE